jgi:hypothetical protein
LELVAMKEIRNVWYIGSRKIYLKLLLISFNSFNNVMDGYKQKAVLTSLFVWFASITTVKMKCVLLNQSGWGKV